ncbi:MAG: macrolide ABC transporter ATP-binding protein [Candidatus Sungbacteria bacterium RIFCSPLOWO2_12_FULL_41_11]|uniref:Macrolide ABC transporter ATP-binding protein n=1 Tax=Candidatus Sungbacteria bacterium RIFCSPLOWO2_12_FULL_41_11 TaxID=1802286 RepID=A0A1G2LT26_9BACT|nr:MAG: ABC transporter related protein [Parcubacteria group bacterium GW2011_GWA2_42_14]OGZ99602.1 MAG: macrolide ABC transporter ATP-binding protein [Candidatus Sungbacteria bacterium RIFCSPHIGHO2_02_FULL_41_12b]OHA14009.1 MAG: macrolide ABC transporter ATP-binding protein [Candidatus Sungbacteria bacterium RIFCSPLOWO2_12_FULL_41_11]
MELIEIQDLKKIYGEGEMETSALAGISLKIAKGEFVAVMGPSGSGKSTLLHILGFLDRPTSGLYFFDGKNMLDYSDEELARLRNKKMGFIFQAFNLLPRTSVLENVKLPLIYSDIALTEWNALAESAIEKVGLTHRIHHQPSQLSGGEKQRVAIARALVLNPLVIFADEPTGNLDSKSGGQVMEAIAKLHEDGHTIILITHETYTAAYAQRIIELKDGLIEKVRSVSERHRTFDHQFIK